MEPTPFADLDAYVALPRLSHLALSPDGTRLVTGVATLNPARTAYTTALWEVDPAGVRPARRLTRSAKGESSAVFAGNGDLLFTSARPDPDGKEPADDAPAALWCLPAGGGEARVIATAPGGIGDPLAARSSDVISVAVPVLPAADDLAGDATLRKTRRELKVAAILHASYPIRYWDHDLGPDQPRRAVAHLGDLADQPAQPLPAPGDKDEAPTSPLALRLVTGPGWGLHEHTADLSADGSALVVSWEVGMPGAARRTRLVVIDTATGTARVLLDDPAAELSDPVFSPDGTTVAYRRTTITDPTTAPTTQAGVVPAAGGTPRILVPGWDRWPESLTWLPDGSGLLVTADDDGRAPVYLLSLDSGRIERVTSDDAAFTDVSVAPDGRTAYALRSSYLAPAAPVRLDLAAFLAGAPGERPPVASQDLLSPVPAPALPGVLRDVAATAADGRRIRSWLALPADASPTHPVPLLLWIHGGPLGSWNAWAWRWNPWLMVARGYAVLMPDPALSTGYGQGFVQRGWGRWGAEPYTDLMSATDAAIALPEIDATRTAAMGGSFGGYMANWVAGHTDRFKAIVTHAGLWALDQFGPTTDASYYWARELTPAMALANSPHLSVGAIRTPMLVIHGDRDYRVPIGEGLRLWYELLSASGLPATDDGTTAHRFLYFPDENHWILTPQHAKVWYETVLAFLSEHVLGESLPYPTTLG